MMFGWWRKSRISYSEKMLFKISNSQNDLWNKEGQLADEKDLIETASMKPEITFFIYLYIKFGQYLDGEVKLYSPYKANLIKSEFLLKLVSKAKLWSLFSVALFGSSLFTILILKIWPRKMKFRLYKILEFFIFLQKFLPKHTI